MTKILFFIGTLSEGGAERVVSLLANYLVDNSFEVEVLKYYKSENSYEINSKVKITTVEEKTGNTNKIKNMLWCHEYFKNNSDIIVSFLAPFNIYAILSNLFNKKPIIVADRNDPLRIPANRIMRFVRNFLYNFADGIVLQTESNKSYFSKSIQNKSYVIFNPINIGKDKGKALETKKENIIVSVGRLERQKNQKLLIDAFSEISNNHNDLKLFIYGDGPYRKELEDYIKENKLKNINLPGNERNVFDKISKAKIFVLSSFYEGMPNALIEAMCLGLPVVSTNVSGARELIENGVNGYLIDQNDKDALVLKMNELMNNETLSKNMGENAKNLADELTIENIASKWISLIKCVLNRYNK